MKHIGTHRPDSPARPSMVVEHRPNEIGICRVCGAKDDGGECPLAPLGNVDVLHRVTVDDGDNFQQPVHRREAARRLRLLP